MAKKRKPATPDTGRLERLLTWLDEEANTLAAGDGNRDASVHAFGFWQQWPFTLGVILTAAGDICGESDEASHWRWRLQVALRRTVGKAVHLLACEAERENMDTTALLRAHQVVDDLLGNAALPFPLPADRRRLVPAKDYGMWREGDVVVKRLAVRMDIRMDDMSAVKPPANDNGWSKPLTAEQAKARFNRTPHTINRWIREDSGPVEMRHAGVGWYQFRERPITC